MSPYPGVSTLDEPSTLTTAIVYTVPFHNSAEELVAPEISSCLRDAADPIAPVGPTGPAAPTANCEPTGDWAHGTLPVSEGEEGVAVASPR
mgnify:CR=1 FL=1